MKKLAILLMVTLFTVAVKADENVRKDDDVKVSYSAKRQFESEFKGAEGVIWTTSDQFQKATFKLAGKKVTAFYDLRGDFIGATQFVKYEDIPVEARKQIEQEYKGYTANEVLQVISRPEDSDSNDVGTFWVDLVNETKSVYVKVAANVDVQLVKQTSLAKQ